MHIHRALLGVSSIVMFSMAKAVFSVLAMRVVVNMLQESMGEGSVAIDINGLR